MNPDDPKLTAHALGELDPTERAEIEKMLRADAVAAMEVETMRAFTAQLRTRLHAEPPIGLLPTQRAEVLTCAVRETLKPKAFAGQGGRWLALAAGVALGVGIALLFPALNSWKTSRSISGAVTPMVRSGGDVRVSLNVESLLATDEAIIAGEWTRDEVSPGIPNPPAVAWTVGRMAFDAGDPLMRFDVKLPLPTIEFSSPAVAQVNAAVSSPNRRTKTQPATGAKTLREARYTAAPVPAAPIFDWSIPRKPEAAE